MGPFSNAGRMRALLLSFAFALLDKSSGSLDFVILDDPAISLDDEHKVRFVDNLVKPYVESGQVILGTHYEQFFQDSEPIFLDEVKLRMIPRQRASDFAGFEPGDLLERVNVALQNNSGQWREVAGNIRLWVERTLSTLSGYCHQPFIVFNDIPQSLDRYSSITNPVIATTERDTIIRIFRGEKVSRILNRLHHNEPIQKPEVVDAMHALEECTKAVRNEIKRFKELYNHALLDRRRGLGVVLEISEFKEDKINRTLSLVRKAAAAHNAEGIEWDINEDYAIENCPVVQVCSDIIAPIALPGQYLLLDWENREPANGDLVVVETSDKEKYIRRIWRKENGIVILEGANPTIPYDPVYITSGTCTIRRIVGILYDQSPITTPNDEWSLRGVNDSWFDSIVGVQVKGTSLEPVARNGQIILIKKQDVKVKITDDMLACVSIRDIGEVIKRCFIKGSQCVLCAINPNEREIPIVADLDSIQHAYVLKGVIFEVGTGRTIEYTGDT
jgi:SOS-response transcriptional repressor LexA